MVLQVKRQQENLVPRPEPINIPSRAALSLLSEQHMHELWWQPCWQTEINSSIVSAAWQHKAVPHKRCFLTDCFGATTRKTQNKNNIYSTGGENIFVRSPTFPLLQFPYWSVEEGGGGLLCSTTETEPSNKRGAAWSAFALLQVAVLTCSVLLRSPLNSSQTVDPGICAILPPTSLQYFLHSVFLSLLLVPFSAFLATACWWRISFHCIRNWRLEPVKLQSKWLKRGDWKALCVCSKQVFMTLPLHLFLCKLNSKVQHFPPQNTFSVPEPVD